MELKHLHNAITALAFLAALLLSTGCDRNAHEGEFPLPESNGGVVVGLQTESGADLLTDNIHLFFFNANDRLAEHRYYDEPEKMALDVIPLPAGSYTVVAVLNTGADFMPPSARASLPSVTLSDFVEWLNAVAADYPDLLTGAITVETQSGEIGRIVITLKVGTEGVRLPVLRLLLTLPGEEMPEYKPQAKSRTAENGYALRCVAELYKKGTDNLVVHRPIIPKLQADGTGLVELQAAAGDYDLHLWTDYTRTDAPQTDTWYHTESLKAVTINTDPYTANTDAKDAACFMQKGISLAETGTEMKVQLQRPLAKYRLIATDVEAYRKLTEMNREKYPLPEELTVKIQYEGFLPSSFDVTQGKPNNAVDGNKIIYSQSLPAIANEDEKVPLSSDWVLVNGAETSVTATVCVTDKDGKTISKTEGVKIIVRRGLLTIASGKFLTAGNMSGGIIVDTEWNGENVVEF